MTILVAVLSWTVTGPARADDDRAPPAAPRTVFIHPPLTVPPLPTAETVAGPLALVLEIGHVFKRFQQAHADHHRRLRRRRGVDGTRPRPASLAAANRAEIGLLRALIAELDRADASAIRPDATALFLRGELHRALAESEFDAAVAAAEAARVQTEEQTEEQTDKQTKKQTDDWAAPDQESPGEPDYQPALAAWRRLVKEFPGHRHALYGLYLLGYYEAQSGRDTRARKHLRALLCPGRSGLSVAMADERPAPNGELVDTYAACPTAAPGQTALIQGAWGLLGDLHFEYPGQLPRAVSAYRRAISARSSPETVIWRYKLAWSYYRLDRMEPALAAFDRVFTLAETGDASAEMTENARMLRDESLQYLSLCIVELWEQGRRTGKAAEPAAVARRFYKNRMKQRQVREIFVKVGDVLAEMVAWPQAIEIWQLALDSWPGHRDNDALRHRIAEARRASGP